MLTPDEYCSIEDDILNSNIEKAITQLPKGKAMSVDLVPDTSFTREEMLRLVKKDQSLIFNGPRISIMNSAKATLLSKTNSKIVEANNTRMIVLQPLVMKIYDRVCLNIIQE
jgi:hypothetical protein